MVQRDRPPQNGRVATSPIGGEHVQGNGSAAGGDQRLLTPAEVAALFRVDPKTVTRWAKAGKLSSIRTLGGHRRYWEAEVRRLLERSAIR
jgi:excisionase family DNA binding protein